MCKPTGSQVLQDMALMAPLMVDKKVNGARVRQLLQALAAHYDAQAEAWMGQCETFGAEVMAPELRDRAARLRAAY